MQIFSQQSRYANQIIPAAAGVFSILLAVGLSFASAPLLWVVLLTLLAGLAGWVVIRYPVAAIPAVLLIAPLAAYEARAGLPIIGFLPIASGQIVFGGLILLWVISWLGRKERSFPQAKSFTWLLAFAGVMLITVLSAESTADGGKEVIKWIQLGLMMLICLDLIQHTVARWERPELGVWLLFGFILLSGLAQAIVGISQFLATDGPESFQILGRFYRAFGTFEQPNPYGGYIAWHVVLLVGICLPQVWHWIAKFLGIPQKESEPMPIWLTALLLGCTGLIGIALIASWSRGAWLAAVAGCGAIAFFLPLKRRYGFALIFAGVLGLVVIFQAGLLPASISDRLASSTDVEFADLRDQEISPTNFAVLERQAFWQAAFGMFESDIWTGVGFGNYDAAYADHFVGRWEQSLAHAHNYYINLLAETGILGTLAYLVFWFVLVWQICRKLPYLSLSDRGIALGILGVWIALTTHHLVDKLYVNNNWLILGAILALQELLLQKPDQKSQSVLSD